MREINTPVLELNRVSQAYGKQLVVKICLFVWNRERSVVCLGPVGVARRP